MELDPAEAEDDQSPIQQLIEIHRRRITVILDNMIDKLCIGCDSKEFIRDAQTSDMVALLHHNPEVMRAVNELVADMSLEERKFIDAMKEFKYCVLELLHTTAPAEKAYNKRIVQAYVNNEKYKIRIAELEKNHWTKMHEHTTKINKNNAKMSDFKEHIEESNEICLEDLHRIVNEAERFMSKITMEAAEEQEILVEDAKNITIQYQTLLEENLRREKALRIKRYKTETVLAGWLAKFDQDIGDLQEKLEEQQNGYNAEKEEFDDLSERAENQLCEYERLMTEKAEVEQAEFDRRRYLFIATRSARHIQRWWRKIYYKFFVKKKPKKGKKKKKK